MKQLRKLEIRHILDRLEDRNLSFRAYDLHVNTLSDYLQPHKKDHFCIILIEEGELDIHIEDRLHRIKCGMVSITFPEQIHYIAQASPALSGKIILFEEVLFCSDILKNELSPYNVHLSDRLNCIFLSNTEFDRALAISTNIQAIYDQPTLIKKEQARFYIKVFLLGLIESIHGSHPILSMDTDKTVYFAFKKLLNQQYKAERTVQYYAAQLAISPKKLNNITKKHCGETAINAIHNRILTEIKRLMLFSERSHKEIAFELGFSAPSALNKFIRAKLKETPTELQAELAQIYNR